ncbi:hypothetical protein EGW08_004034 [Elysia chlorotica]|uniref:Uncharacterized protein n=1 Tax=Elysia chlorotica TaxID=188477 RepID=A0A3S1BH51_ELYCH|nr:hypothetical protein EGW08_004034 [Elysia chlorotica]
MHGGGLKQNIGFWFESQFNLRPQKFYSSYRNQYTVPVFSLPLSNTWRCRQDAQLTPEIENPVGNGGGSPVLVRLRGITDDCHGSASADQPLFAPAPTSAELRLVLQLLGSLNERMERLERQDSRQPGQTKRLEGRRRRRRRTGHNQMLCHRCKQSDSFSRECRARAPMWNGNVMSRLVDLGGKGSRPWTTQLWRCPPCGESSAWTQGAPPALYARPLCLTDLPLLSRLFCLLSGPVGLSMWCLLRRRRGNVDHPSRQHIRQEDERHVPPQPAVPCQGQTFGIVDDVEASPKNFAVAFRTPAD